MIDNVDKLRLQEKEYYRPYHHLLDLTNCSFFDVLWWGLEYYSYVSFVIEYFSRLIRHNDIKLVADVGCGDGKILYELAKRYPTISFEGFDISKRAIKFAEAFSYGLSNVRFFDYSFENATKKYDVVLCIETLEHIPDPEIRKFIEILYSNLKDDGILIITVPTTNIKKHPKHYRHYNIDILQKEVSDYFVIGEVHYLHNIGVRTRLINFLLVNPVFILSFAPLRKALFKYYRNRLRIATETSGAHLFAVLYKEK